VALAHRDRPLPPLPPTVGTDVCAFVMRLTAKDPVRRMGDAAEVAVWAGLLRDGVGVDALRAWPDPPAGTPPAASWLQRRTVLAYACVAVTAVVVIVLVSVIGFASPPAPVTASPASPPSPYGAAAPPAGGPVTNPVMSPDRAPAASPLAQQEPAGVARAGETVTSGHGHGYGRDNGGGKAKGQAGGVWNGLGKGNGNGQGD